LEVSGLLTCLPSSGEKNNLANGDVPGKPRIIFERSMKIWPVHSVAASRPAQGDCVAAQRKPYISDGNRIIFNDVRSVCSEKTPNRRYAEGRYALSVTDGLSRKQVTHSAVGTSAGDVDIPGSSRSLTKLRQRETVTGGWLVCRPAGDSSWKGRPTLVLPKCRVNERLHRAALVASEFKYTLLIRCRCGEVEDGAAAKEMQRIGRGIRTTNPGITREVAPHAIKRLLKYLWRSAGGRPSRLKLIGHEQHAQYDVVIDGVGQELIVIGLDRWRPGMPRGLLGIGQIKINGDRSSSGPSEFMQRTGEVGSRPGPPSQSFQRPVINVGHDNLGRHRLCVPGKMLLFEIQQPLVPAVKSSGHIDQNDDEGRRHR